MSIITVGSMQKDNLRVDLTCLSATRRSIARHQPYSDYAGLGTLVRYRDFVLENLSAIIVV